MRNFSPACLLHDRGLCQDVPLARIRKGIETEMPLAAPARGSGPPIPPLQVDLADNTV